MEPTKAPYHLTSQGRLPCAPSPSVTLATTTPTRATASGTRWRVRAARHHDGDLERRYRRSARLCGARRREQRAGRGANAGGVRAARRHGRAAGLPRALAFMASGAARAMEGAYLTKARRSGRPSTAAHATPTLRPRRPSRLRFRDEAGGQVWKSSGAGVVRPRSRAKRRFPARCTRRAAGIWLWVGNDPAAPARPVQARRARTIPRWRGGGGALGRWLLGFQGDGNGCLFFLGGVACSRTRTRVRLWRSASESTSALALAEAVVRLGGGARSRGGRTKSGGSSRPRSARDWRHAMAAMPPAGRQAMVVARRPTASVAGGGGGGPSPRR